MNDCNTHQIENLKERISHLKWRIQRWDYSRLWSQQCTLAQYRICIWVLSEYFSTIPNQSWETHEDGVGMCWNNDWEFENWNIHGSKIEHQLSEAKDQILNDIGLSIFEPWIKACIYHREWVWCILWDLKSPRCAIEPDGDVSRKYNTDKLKSILEKIQLAWATEENMFQEISPENNWDLVLELLDEVESYL